MTRDELEVLRLRLRVLACNLVMESLVKHLLVAQACAGEPFQLRLRAQVIQTLPRSQAQFAQKVSSAGYKSSDLESVGWLSEFDDVANGVRGLMGA